MGSTRNFFFLLRESESSGGVEKEMIDLHYFALHLHSFTLRAREIIFRDMIYDVFGSDTLIELIHLFLPESKRL